MYDSHALGEIKRLAARGEVRLRKHAWLRMAERGASIADVIRALRTATRAYFQTDRETYRVDGGFDLVGEEMTVIVVIEADAVVVTVF